MCTNLAEALVMSEGDVQVFRCDDDAGRWFCVLTLGKLRIGVELAEEIAGSGDLAIVALEVRPRAGTLTAGTLRGAAYGSAFRAARAAVEQVAAKSQPRVLASPGDPPPAFRSDRRGRASRTEGDYARLALSYLALNVESRRRAAARWAEDFPEGGTKRTWLNRLVRAKRYVDGESLTDEGMALAYGDDWLERLEFDEKWDNALNIATIMPGDEIWRKLQRDGKDPRKWRAAAQRTIGVNVDDQGRAYAAHSPETPDECGER